ncbi:MAG: DNA-3-methyladenine glycosylase family protein [Sumerlaeia bacterium]
MSSVLTLPINPENEVEALCALDADFTQLAKKFTPFPLPIRPFTFNTFVSAINSQSISTKAADTIIKRLLKVLNNGEPVTAEHINATTPEQLRQLGLSNAKSKAIKDLAELWIAENLEQSNWDEWTDKQLLEHFTKVPGIGPWTVKMILIFGLRRADIFPEGDLAIRIGIQKLKGLPERPTQQESRTISLQWQPYRTIASVFLWKSLITPDSDLTASKTSVWNTAQKSQLKEQA